jgi:hypothetical protein
MKTVKRVLCVVIALVLVGIIGYFGLILYVLLGSNVKSSDNIAYYQVLSGEQDGSDMISVLNEEFDMPCPFNLPHLSELEPYTHYRFDYTAVRESVFQTHSYILILSYDAETYPQIKDMLAQEYTYLTDTFPGSEETKRHQPEFQLDGFAFRAAQAGERDFADVQHMLFVGTRDDRGEIAIIYTHNQDLDFISTSLGSYISEETGWKRVITP